MPIYEYVCSKCRSHFEVIQKVGDPPLKRCSNCKSRLEKKVSRTSFQLKGSGWYKTDYPSTHSTTVKDKAEPATEKKSEPATKKAQSSDRD